MADTLTLETSRDRLAVDRASGRLVSLRPKNSPRTELLAADASQPVFALQYLDDQSQYRTLDSTSAQQCSAVLAESAAGQLLTLVFRGVGGLDLDVTLTVRTAATDRFSRWGCSLRNLSGLRVVDVQFPMVVVPAAGAIALPAGHGGQLIAGDGLAALPADEPRLWQLIPGNGNSQHYPGRVFAQFMAWSGPTAGVYLACNDTRGHAKLLQPVRRSPGVRLGLAHVGDWPERNGRVLEYDVLLGSFTGDWQDAADLYRDWALCQHWATPLTRRTDVPAWLLDSPPHITIRLQGYVDDGPAPLIGQFLPYEKCIPLLEGVAARVGAPLVAVLMSWERGGPWVYPDCFPPVGGDESLTRFCRLARERGWHVGSFCNGTRWVLKHLLNGYDGTAYFHDRGGERCACRQHDGELWQETWDRNWRPSYATCMAQDLTKADAIAFVRRLIGWGMESVQFFDQNCNAATFPCFAADHGHPPVPGRWMADAMASMIAAFRQAAAEAGEQAVIQSTECPCNEFCLPLFQQSDVRVSPPGCGQTDFIPLYHYLYHECTILHGMMNIGPEPYALPSRNAWNGVWGQIPGAVLTGDGTLLNRETWNWAEWEPKVGSNDDALEMIRTVTALRRGAGRPFLVYGRMQRPAQVETETVCWEHHGRHHELPAVAHAAWQAPDGRYGVVLANWTAQERTVTVADPRLAGRCRVTGGGGKRPVRSRVRCGCTLTLRLPPLSCTLVATPAGAQAS
jgi:hypothetical protein